MARFALVFFIGFTFSPVRPALAQELEPRAYASNPVGLHILAAVYTRSEGGLLFDPTVPIEDVTASVNGAALGYFHSIGFLGRSANLSLSVPYMWGTFQGIAFGDFTKIRRSGLSDGRFRFAVNLVGAPALKPKDFVKTPQKTNLGISFTLTAPTGQYDHVKLVNPGTNRWAFKPELGISHVKGKWRFEGAAGVWFITENNRFFGEFVRKQDPIGSFQGHLIYSFKPGLWLAFDGNFFIGGKVTTDGVETAQTFRNSRLGLTFSVPLNRRNSLKFSYNDGFVTRLGSDFSSFSIAYQFVWLGL